jgi:DsbC/DsbD-like thiol-disulfide interchange protein
LFEFDNAAGPNSPVYPNELGAGCWQNQVAAIKFIYDYKNSSMKKTILLTLGIAFMAALATAQPKNPVQWSFSSKKISDKQFELHFKATIQPGWHIYTIDHNADIGVPTTFSLGKNPLGEYSGKIKVLGKPVSMKDPSTGEMVKFYENTVSFVQVVNLKAAVKTSFTGTLEYMACDDKMCLPPTEKQFTIAL